MAGVGVLAPSRERTLIFRISRYRVIDQLVSETGRKPIGHTLPVASTGFRGSKHIGMEVLPLPIDVLTELPSVIHFEQGIAFTALSAQCSIAQKASHQTACCVGVRLPTVLPSGVIPQYH